ncbi:sodium-dependent bicarbonate transport family permease [Mycobacterium conspicuum]|nr:sodium-dependent bicarbonate transport family permease [Mycobacterium conspicuum]ORV39963.1 sodium-dependent bicarbonate transport family permease [Mycobacterium conspicuum]
MLHAFWQNFTHNLFKPLLLFFYFGFLIPILRVRFEFPNVIRQALTMYLLVAIGWQGGEQLAAIKPAHVGAIAGFMVLGFVVNLAIGAVTYVALSWLSGMRRVDRAMVAGYYGSDSAGTFAICVAVLTGLGIAFDAYLPVMLAVMEIPGCLVALYLAARLRNRGMDPDGHMPDEPGYRAPATLGTGPGTAAVGEREIASGEGEYPARQFPHAHYLDRPASKTDVINEVLLNPGICLLLGAIVIGFVSGLQGPSVVHDDNSFFVSAFQGALCLFLLEMGMTASRKLKDLRSGGVGFILFALVAPNVFATLGIIIAHGYAFYTQTEFKQGTYALFAVLCAAASYITVPAVQRLAVPEASPTLPLAAALGLTFSYNATIGIPLYIEIARVATWWGL